MVMSLSYETAEVTFNDAQNRGRIIIHPNKVSAVCSTSVKYLKMNFDVVSFTPA